MSGKKHEQLDHVICEIRAQDISPPELEDSARRVWQRIETANAALATVQVARGCGAIRADLPLLRRGELSPARRFLVEDHLRECQSCRAYGAGAPDPAAVAENWRLASPAGRTPAWSLAKYSWAAAVVVLVGVVAWVCVHYLAEPTGTRAQIESIAGHAYLVSLTKERPLNAGEQVGQDEMVRTATDSHAILRLLDGSRVEMNQRTEVSVSANVFRKTTIYLNEGNIIVQARHRDTARLYVRTPDCTVSDTGTIFSIESGTKGSRVGVIEGTVSVTHDGKESVLQAGQSVSTAQSMNTIPVSGQIGWSENRRQYLALLDEFSRLGHRFEQIPSPEPRYQSQILPFVPGDTVLYLSVPNLGNMFAQGEQIFRDELQRSSVLRDWWTHVTPPEQDASLEEAIGKIETASRYLGDEMVLVSGLGAKDGPLLLAPIKNPGLGHFLQQQISSLADGSRPPMRIVDEKSLASISPSNRELIALVRADMLLAGTPSAVLRMNAALAHGRSGFDDTDFGRQVHGVYNQGAQVLFAADLRHIMAHAQRTEHAKSVSGTQATDNSLVDSLGFGDMKYLIATHGDTSGQTENRAVLGFERERGGLASWLGAPSPMGSLDFVSANASAAVSVVTKAPAMMFDDVFRMVQQHNQTNVNAELHQEEPQIGVYLRNNLAEALGGEMTFALDGPILPKPSWKMIAEVNEPSVLQQSIATLVQLVGQHVLISGEPAVALEQQQGSDRTFYKITFAQANSLTEIDYTFSDGYLVAGSSRAVVLNALATHTNGNSLVASGSFHALLPRDSYANFSALVYWNLGPVVRPFAAQFGSANQGLLQHLATDSKPAAICGYGGTKTIEVASTANLLDLQPDVVDLLNLFKQKGLELLVARTRSVSR